MTERTTSLPEFHVPPSLQQAAMPPRVELEGVVQRYPAPEGKGEVTVLDGIDLTLEGRGINVLLGPSGCGKSTLMRMMGGVRPPDVKSPTEGTVKIDGAFCEGVHDDVVTVFQRYANRPDLSVEDNIRFPFRTKLWRDRVPLEEQNTRVEQMLKAVGLLEKRGLRPAQLSGGQNQRVALARALVLRPRVLLMDEPFGALDAQTREEMQRLLLEIIAEYHCLIVFITHDVEEALYLGDRVLVMSHPPAKVAEDFRNPQPVPRDRLWMQSTEGRALFERVRRRLGHIREVAE